MKIRFNPYRVFKFVATACLHRGHLRLHLRFQSLSGFQVRCNVHDSFQSVLFIKSFNPYRVFKFVATCAHAGHSSSDSFSFQSLSGFQVRCNFQEPDDGKQAHQFQSLSGFQVRCNPGIGSSNGPTAKCFNPYRVFKFVATEPCVFCNVDVRAVSIPIGFSSSLQRHPLNGSSWL